MMLHRGLVGVVGLSAMRWSVFDAAMPNEARADAPGSASPRRSVLRVKGRRNRRCFPVEFEGKLHPGVRPIVSPCGPKPVMTERFRTQASATTGSPFGAGRRRPTRTSSSSASPIVGTNSRACDNTCSIPRQSASRQTRNGLPRSGPILSLIARTAPGGDPSWAPPLAQRIGVRASQVLIRNGGRDACELCRPILAISGPVIVGRAHRTAPVSGVGNGSAAAPSGNGKPSRVVRLRVGMAMVLLWWAPFWLLGPPIADLLKGLTHPPSAAAVTTAIVVLQTIVGLIGFWLAGTEAKSIIVVPRNDKPSRSSGRCFARRSPHCPHRSRFR